MFKHKEKPRLCQWGGPRILLIRVDGVWYHDFGDFFAEHDHLWWNYWIFGTDDPLQNQTG